MTHRRAKPLGFEDSSIYDGDEGQVVSVNGWIFSEREHSSQGSKSAHARTWMRTPVGGFALIVRGKGPPQVWNLGH